MFRDPLPDDLIEAAREGDRAAFGSIYRRYHADVVRYCARRCGPSRAEDVAHEVFVRVLERFHTFRPGNALWPWLQRVASNVCIDDRRREPGVRTVTLDVDADMARPEQGYRSVELRISMAPAFARVPARHRLLMWQRDVEDRSLEEIAAADGSTVAAVRNATWRARATIRSALGDVRVIAPLAAAVAWACGRARRTCAAAGSWCERVGPPAVIWERAILAGLAVALATGSSPSPPEVHDAPHPPARPVVSAELAAHAQHAVTGPSGRDAVDRRSLPSPMWSPATVQTDWNEDRATPKRTRVRLEVRDLDGRTLHWHATGVDCEVAGPAVEPPDPSPVGTGC